jgi:hypothetical protein
MEPQQAPSAADPSARGPAQLGPTTKPPIPARVGLLDRTCHPSCQPNAAGPARPNLPPKPPIPTREGLLTPAIHPSRRTQRRRACPTHPSTRRIGIGTLRLPRAGGQAAWLEGRGTTRSEGLLASPSCFSPIQAVTTIKKSGQSTQPSRNTRPRTRPAEAARASAPQSPA